MEETCLIKKGPADLAVINLNLRGSKERLNCHTNQVSRRWEGREQKRYSARSDSEHSPGSLGKEIEKTNTEYRQ